MKIIEILPELDLGGVERHVIDLSRELSRRGHEVLVISYGGRMLRQLAPDVEHRALPVHKKNPFTMLRCAEQISKWVRDEGWQVLHAHSRVPAWIAERAVARHRALFIVTAHVCFHNRSRWIYRPYRCAKTVVCVSEAVREAMKECFYDNTQVILNGLQRPLTSWCRPESEAVKFLYVGRLSESKGLHEALRALPQGGNWSLDVLGDGPMRAELEALTDSLKLGSRITFHGYAEYEVCDNYMSKASCLILPSRVEGMPLTLARAVQIGLPVIASDIRSIADMCATPELLIPAGDIAAWSKAVRGFIDGALALPQWKEIPSLEAQVDAVEQIYFG